MTGDTFLYRAPDGSLTELPPAAVSVTPNGYVVDVTNPIVADILAAVVVPDIKPDDELDPTAEDGEPEAPDVRTDPVEDDPSATDEPVTED